VQKTSLYRHFDADGRLLYVGVALSATYRLSQHRLDSHWFHSIARVDLEHHRSRAHALYAEAIAIREEKPLHNRMRPIPSDPDALPDELATSLEPAKKRIPCVRLPGDGLPRTIGYTVLASEEQADGQLEAIAATILDCSGFITADIGWPAEGFIRVMKTAQHSGTRIITDRPEAFERALLLLAGRGVTVQTATW
jgi:hypothetical protein